jgi:hypothetical protein
LPGWRGGTRQLPKSVPPRVRSGKRRFLNYLWREVSRVQIKNDDNRGRQRFKFGRLPDLTLMIFSGGGEEWGADSL